MTQPPDPSIQDTSSASQSADDEVLNIISSVQSELERLKAKQRENTDEHAALAQLQRERSEHEESLAQREQTLASACAAMEERAAAMEAHNQELAQRDAQLKQERQQIADQSRELERERAQTQESQRLLSAKQDEMDAISATLSEESAALSQQQSRFQEKRDALEKAFAARQQEVDNLERELAAEKTGVDQANREAERLKEEFESQLVQLRADQDEVEREQDRLEQMRLKLVEQQSRAEHDSAESDERRGHAASLETQVETLSRQRDEAIARAEQTLDSAAAETQSLQSRLAELEERERSLCEELAQANQLVEASAPKEKIAELNEQIDKRQKAIETLAQELRSAQSENESLVKDLDQACQTQASDVATDEVQQRRRDRLHRIHQALHHRVHQLKQAKETIDAKMQEADRVAAMRQSIAAERKDLEKREHRLAARAGASRGVSALFLGALAFVSLGVMSWAVVDRAFPATYLASATLSVDDSDGALTDAQRDSWTQYLSSLTSDPRLIEVAAHRMGRRGVSELATGGALANRLQSDLDLSTPAPGRLTLSLKGQGAQRTERLLDTLLASVVSVANDARNQRDDGASTVVADPPKAASEPLNDPRPIYAAIGWGVSSAVLILLCIVVWIRVGAARRKLDEESAQMLAAGGRTFSTNSF